jgi:hypothetical protein
MPSSRLASSAHAAAPTQRHYHRETDLNLIGNYKGSDKSIRRHQFDNMQNYHIVRVRYPTPYFSTPTVSATLPSASQLLIHRSKMTIGATMQIITSTTCAPIIILVLDGS